MITLTDSQMIVSMALAVTSTVGLFCGVLLGLAISKMIKSMSGDKKCNCKKSNDTSSGE